MQERAERDQGIELPQTPPAMPVPASGLPALEPKDEMGDKLLVRMGRRIAYGVKTVFVAPSAPQDTTRRIRRQHDAMKAAQAEEAKAVAAAKAKAPGGTSAIDQSPATVASGTIARKSGTVQQTAKASTARASEVENRTTLRSVRTRESGSTLRPTDSLHRMPPIDYRASRRTPWFAIVTCAVLTVLLALAGIAAWRLGWF